MARPSTTQKLIDLDVAIGRHLRVLREQHNVPRELLVLAAQRVGIPWTVATITLIERGRRRLTTGELFLLPQALTTCLPPTHRAYRMDDLIPESLPNNMQLAITPECQAYPEWLRQLILHHGVRTLDFEGRYGALCTTRRDQEQPHYDEVTLRAAHALHVSIETIAQAAAVLWEGRTFIEERDARGHVRLPAGASPRYIQAVRGHIARELMQELRDHLKKQKEARKAATPKRPISKKK